MLIWPISANINTTFSKYIVVVIMILFSQMYVCAFGAKARVMQSLGQALEIELLDKDEGNTDDKLGR